MTFKGASVLLLSVLSVSAISADAVPVRGRVVGAPDPTSPLKAGDLILAINGETFKTIQSLRQKLWQALDSDVELSYDRSNEKCVIRMKVTPGKWIIRDANPFNRIKCSDAESKLFDTISSEGWRSAKRQIDAFDRDAAPAPNVDLAEAWIIVATKENWRSAEPLLERALKSLKKNETDNAASVALCKFVQSRILSRHSPDTALALYNFARTSGIDCSQLAFHLGGELLRRTPGNPAGLQLMRECLNDDPFFLEAAEVLAGRADLKDRPQYQDHLSRACGAEDPDVNFANAVKHTLSDNNIEQLRAVAASVGYKAGTLTLAALDDEIGKCVKREQPDVAIALAALALRCNPTVARAETLTDLAIQARSYGLAIRQFQSLHFEGVVPYPDYRPFIEVYRRLRQSCFDHLTLTAIESAQSILQKGDFKGAISYLETEYKRVGDPELMVTAGVMLLSREAWSDEIYARYFQEEHTFWRNCAIQYGMETQERSFQDSWEYCAIAVRAPVPQRNPGYGRALALGHRNDPAANCLAAMLYSTSDNEAALRYLKTAGEKLNNATKWRPIYVHGKLHKSPRSLVEALRVLWKVENAAPPEEDF